MFGFYEDPGHRIHRSIGRFLSCHGYPVDLEDKGGFVAIAL
jgi:hypothetical protein